jgi:hypothetical protein
MKSRNATDDKAEINNRQLFSSNFYYQLKRFISMLEIFVTLVVPPVLIVVMNGLIIHSLFQYNKTFEGDASSKHKIATYSTPLKTIQQKFNVQVSRSYICILDRFSYFDFSNFMPCII